MILFLNKVSLAPPLPPPPLPTSHLPPPPHPLSLPSQRDLFEMKLKKKDLTCWDLRAPPATTTTRDWYLKQKFLDKNKGSAPGLLPRHLRHRHVEHLVRDGPVFDIIPQNPARWTPPMSRR